MNTIKGIGTEKGLLTTFTDESRARNHYIFSNEQASKRSYYRIVEEEGFNEIAVALRAIITTERRHKKYRALLKNLKNNNLEMLTM